MKIQIVLSFTLRTELQAHNETTKIIKKSQF